MKYLILGAGPAGLTFANMLKQAGETSFLVLEKENEAGGLCRSVNVDGSPFDIGGGHFLDVRRPDVNKFLFEFMPESEWNIFDRDSKIDLNGDLIDYPLESNIWQTDINSQVEYLKSIALAGCNIGKPMPEEYSDWIYWKLGSKIAEEYMIPYNTKMFGKEIYNLGTYWMEKLPNVSFEQTLLSCLIHKPYGELPCVHKFYYPKKYGYGELWKRMASAISDHIEYNKSIKTIDFKTRSVIAESGEKYDAEVIITTIPWLEFTTIIGMPDEIKSLISRLKYGSVQTEYFSDTLETTAHWIYCPNLNLTYNRILVRHNFCTNSKGYWTETQGHRIEPNKESPNFKYFNKYAYPYMTKDKPEIMKKILGWAKQHNVYGLGRWGEHEYYNSDTTVDIAIKMAEKFLSRKDT